MQLFDALAEQKIQEAIERGELDDLPGSGKPLELDDDPLVPEDLRVAHRVLKNAGFVPPELELRKEICAAEQALASTPTGPDRARALRRLQLLNTKLAESRPGRGLRVPSEYYRKLIEKLG
jgi:DnaJ-like protein